MKGTSLADALHNATHTNDSWYQLTSTDRESISSTPRHGCSLCRYSNENDKDNNNDNEKAPGGDTNNACWL